MDWIEGLDSEFQNLSGVPFNSGRIEGGIKSNMIAAECEMLFGFRPLPGMDSKVMLEQMRNLAITEANIPAEDFELTAKFFGPTLPAANQNFDEAYVAAEQLAASCHITVGPAVDFWTEASLFSQAGMTALVYGPGNIEQAHTPDEWVALEQLETVVNSYVAIISGN